MNNPILENVSNQKKQYFNQTTNFWFFNIENVLSHHLNMLIQLSTGARYLNLDPGLHRFNVQTGKALEKPLVSAGSSEHKIS